MQEFETLKQLVLAAEPDALVAATNKSAGTRTRKRMQEIKAAAQVIRSKILVGRSNKSPTPGTAA